MCWWLTCALMTDASHGRCRVAPLFGAVSTAPHHPTPASILDRVCVLPGLSSGTVSEDASSHAPGHTLFFRTSGFPFSGLTTFAMQSR